MLAAQFEAQHDECVTPVDGRHGASTNLVETTGNLFRPRVIDAIGIGVDVVI